MTKIIPLHIESSMMTKRKKNIKENLQFSSRQVSSLERTHKWTWTVPVCWVFFFSLFFLDLPHWVIPPLLNIRNTLHISHRSLVINPTILWIHIHFYYNGTLQWHLFKTFYDDQLACGCYSCWCHTKKTFLMILIC